MLSRITTTTLGNSSLRICLDCTYTTSDGEDAPPFHGGSDQLSWTLINWHFIQCPWKVNPLGWADFDIQSSHWWLISLPPHFMSHKPPEHVGTLTEVHSFVDTHTWQHALVNVCIKFILLWCLKHQFGAPISCKQKMQYACISTIIP